MQQARREKATAREVTTEARRREVTGREPGGGRGSHGIFSARWRPPKDFSNCSKLGVRRPSTRGHGGALSLDVQHCSFECGMSKSGGSSVSQKFLDEDALVRQIREDS